MQQVVSYMNTDRYMYNVKVLYLGNAAWVLLGPASLGQGTSLSDHRAWFWGQSMAASVSSSLVCLLMKDQTYKLRLVMNIGLVYQN